MTRDDWLKGALGLCGSGIDSVKVAPLAKQMSVTTGSFYWHFRNRRELLQALLDYWERDMTDAPIVAARQYPGPPAARILYLMQAVMIGGHARYDLPIWHWAQSDARANRVFKRVLKKRFLFATWMFAEAGFSKEQATNRGRMMVILLMGESTLVPGSMAERKSFLVQKHAILTAPESQPGGGA